MSDNPKKKSKGMNYKIASHFEKIKLSDIVSTFGERYDNDIVLNLSSMGYGTFVSPEGSDKPTLSSLGLNDKKEFVKLIEKFANGPISKKEDIVFAAENMRKIGQLQPIRVVKNGDKYSIIFGLSRFLQKMYLYAKYGDEPTIDACVLSECDEEAAMLMFNSENAQRTNANPITFGNYIEKTKIKNCEQLQNKLGVDWQTIRRNYIIATTDFTQQQIDKIINGEISLFTAYRKAQEKRVITITCNRCNAAFPSASFCPKCGLNIKVFKG